MSGENQVSKSFVIEHTGSSPHKQGKPQRHENRTLCLRIIPARAGKTFQSAGLLSMLLAHPRVSGENISESLSESLHQGSSPRERGKPIESVSIAFNAGLIPA